MTGNNRLRCDDCSVLVEGPDLEAFSDAYLAHARSRHPDWSFSDVAIRNVAEATQRITGSTKRLDTIGPVTIHPVSVSRISDWLNFFDHHAFAGNPVDACCYCAGPHVIRRGQQGGIEQRPWRQNRELMISLLRSGRAYGYLAYADDKPAGWVNASMRSECATYRLGDSADPSDRDVIAISCFGIAPPYRGHGLVHLLLQRVLADAVSRGAHWVEAYPFNDQENVDEDNWLGQAALLTAHGFDAVGTLQRQSVMRFRVDPA
ncbi:N-acetyltransferase family protein [Actinopolymorpha pittospori]